MPWGRAGTAHNFEVAVRTGAEPTESIPPLAAATSQPKKLVIGQRKTSKETSFPGLHTWRVDQLD